MEGGRCDKTAGKKVIALPTAITKKVVSFFQEKIGVTPSVAAPGDNNLSDATDKCTNLDVQFQYFSEAMAPPQT